MLSLHLLCVHSISSGHALQRIPPAYRKHIRGRKPRIIHLSGPSGDTWQVTLAKAEDELYFEHGWPTFVRDHAIENGELLVFRCLGESKFNVEIFSRNGCPKESAFSAKRPQGPQEAKKSKKRRAVDSGKEWKHFFYFLSICSLLIDEYIMSCQNLVCAVCFLLILSHFW